VPYDCGFGLLVLVDSTPRCLGAYIPSLSNSSSTSDLIGTFFHVGFELRCVQLLPRVAWLPGIAFSHNRYTSGDQT